jgi:Lon-like ATP-dependent protease
VQDLGEEVLPEAAAEDKKAIDSAASNTSESQPHTVPSTKDGEATTVTTEPRKPLNVPDTVKVRITTENLKDYVGPPIYHRDRFYVVPPPAGVSTGLGYLGNGSGAVMPVEAIVRANY